MNNNNYIYLLLSLLILLSCKGEDRTHEYIALTETDHWIEDAMKKWYLWGDSLKTIDDKNYFKKPEEFIKMLTAQAPEKDKWTYCSNDTIEKDYHERGYFNHVDSYGLDLAIITDPTSQTTKQYARILTVYPNSAAEKCNLQRGQFIGYLDNAKITSNNMSNLKNGDEHKLVVYTLKGMIIRNGAEVRDTLFWENEDGDTILLEKSSKVEERQVLVSKMFEEDEAAYLMLANLNTTDFMEQIKLFKTHSPKGLVLDLRLCNDGTIENACKLASLIVPSNYSSDTFTKTIWSTHKANENKSYKFEKTSDNLGILWIRIITGIYTQGAAEWLIQGIRNAFPQGGFSIIGTTTAGQNVLLKDVPTPYKVTLHTTSAYVADANGYYDYSSGIAPTDTVNEYNYVSLFPYGDENEILLNRALEK